MCGWFANLTVCVTPLSSLQSSHPVKVDPQLESQLAETRQELAAVREMNQQLQDQLSAREVESIKVRVWLQVWQSLHRVARVGTAHSGTVLYMHVYLCTSCVGMTSTHYSLGHGAGGCRGLLLYWQ